MLSSSDNIELNLSDSKTGKRTVPLSQEAAKVPPHRGQTDSQPERSLKIIRKRADIGDVRLHDCRHSFASRTLALGESLPVIVKLLEYTQVETPARYAHPKWRQGAAVCRNDHGPAAASFGLAHAPQLVEIPAKGSLIPANRQGAAVRRDTTVPTLFSQ